MATLYRAEAQRRHSGRATTWRGKWCKDPAKAIAQAQRWERREPAAKINIVTLDGGKVSLRELERQRLSEGEQ